MHVRNHRLSQNTEPLCICSESLAHLTSFFATTDKVVPGHTAAQSHAAASGASGDFRSLRESGSLAEKNESGQKRDVGVQAGEAWAYATDSAQGEQGACATSLVSQKEDAGTRAPDNHSARHDEDSVLVREDADMPLQGMHESGAEDRDLGQSAGDAPITALCDDDAALQHRGPELPKFIDLRIHIQGAFGWCSSLNDGEKDEEVAGRWEQTNLGHDYKRNHADHSQASSPKNERSGDGKSSPRSATVTDGTGDAAARVTNSSGRKLGSNEPEHKDMAQGIDDYAKLDPQKLHYWSEDDGVAERLWDDVVSGRDLNGVKFVPVRLVEVCVHGRHVQAVSRCMLYSNV